MIQPGKDLPLVPKAAQNGVGVHAALDEFNSYFPVKSQGAYG
ncbi:MAG TPA: hypothetical protein VKB88_38380 [Bryobacteraceae bacterium]|nr:hypothetical protein [Bryobacteraceae bacterium]